MPVTQGFPDLGHLPVVDRIRSFEQDQAMRAEWDEWARRWQPSIDELNSLIDWAGRQKARRFAGITGDQRFTHIYDNDFDAN